MSAGFAMAEAHRDRFAAHREFYGAAEAFPLVLAHRNLLLVRGLQIISPADGAGKTISPENVSEINDREVQLPVVLPGLGIWQPLRPLPGHALGGSRLTSGQCRHKTRRH